MLFIFCQYLLNITSICFKIWTQVKRIGFDINYPYEINDLFISYQPFIVLAFLQRNITL